MPRTRVTEATRTSKRAVVVEGFDVVASSFERDASTIRSRAARTVLEHARQAADEMRTLTGSSRVAESITSDTEASSTPTGVYADAGPDRRKSNQAFIARFLERGTVKMAPQPFAQPASDRVAPAFARAVRELL